MGRVHFLPGLDHVSGGSCMTLLSKAETVLCAFESSLRIV